MMPFEYGDKVCLHRSQGCGCLPYTCQLEPPQETLERVTTPAHTKLTMATKTPEVYQRKALKWRQLWRTLILVHHRQH